MFWIIIPIWINWFFAEFFQEKHGTSFGNAISNGAIAILASVDWARYLYRLIVDGTLGFSFSTFLKFFVAVLVFSYGVYIIIQGARSKEVVYFVGRIRWVTYVLVMFTPIVYLHNVKTDIGLNFETIIAILIFFPLYYWIVEFFDKMTPEPDYYKKGKA